VDIVHFVRHDGKAGINSEAKSIYARPLKFYGDLEVMCQGESDRADVFETTAGAFFGGTST